MRFVQLFHMGWDHHGGLQAGRAGQRQQVAAVGVGADVPGRVHLAAEGGRIGRCIGQRHAPLLALAHQRHRQLASRHDAQVVDRLADREHLAPHAALVERARQLVLARDPALGEPGVGASSSA